MTVFCSTTFNGCSNLLTVKANTLHYSIYYASNCAFLSFVECKIFEGTSSSSFPKVQLHPDGQRLVLITNGGLRGVSLTNENWFAMKKESRLVDHVYCAFSPNGCYLAVLSRMQMLCKLSIYSCSHNSVRLIDSAMCHKLCPGFIGNSAVSDHIECKWSPDSQYIAISSSFGILFVVNHDNLTNHCTVIPGLLHNCSISTARAYDFDPRYFSNIMAVCTDNRKLFLVNISSQYLLYMTDIIRSGSIECVQFSSDGEILALAVSNFRIYLYDSNHGSLVRIINPCVHCPDLAAMSPSFRPTIIRMSFSQSREQLAVSSSDGMVRIWQLSPLFSLQHLCKRSILSSVNASRIQQLPLPAKLKAFLKSYPT